MDIINTYMDGNTYVETTEELKSDQCFENAMPYAATAAPTTTTTTSHIACDLGEMWTV